MSIVYCGPVQPEGQCEARCGSVFICGSDGTVWHKDQGDGKSGWSQIQLASSGGGGSASFARHTPTGAIDGVNTTFVFSPAPGAASSFLLLWNGLAVDPGDYSLAGGVLTATGFTPKTGDRLYGLY